MVLPHHSKKNPPSCSDDYLCKKSIQSPGEKEYLSIAANIELTARRIDVHDLVLELVIGTAFAGCICMMPDTRYVELNSFKSLDIPKCKLWNGSNPGVLYAIVTTFLWTSCMASIKEGHSENDISSRESFCNLAVGLCYLIVKSSPKWTEELRTLISFLRSRSIHDIPGPDTPSMSLIFHYAQTSRVLSSHR